MDNNDKLVKKQTLQKHTDKVWHLSWNFSENIFASCSSDKNIYIWGYDENTKNYTTKAVLHESHSKTVRALAWDYSGNYLASASFDNTINIWKRKDNNFECIASLEGHENEVKSVSWSV
jgi:WD40 repeat protein